MWWNFWLYKISLISDIYSHSDDVNDIEWQISSWGCAQHCFSAILHLVIFAEWMTESSWALQKLKSEISVCNHPQLGNIQKLRSHVDRGRGFTPLLIINSQITPKQEAAHQIKKNNVVRNTSGAAFFTQTGLDPHKTLRFHQPRGRGSKSPFWFYVVSGRSLICNTIYL